MPNKDFIYEKPPLIEVIAEIRWKTLPVTAMPGVFIDPHFNAFKNQLDAALKKQGFAYTEKLVEDNIPIELTAGMPLVRYRKAKNQWPLYQAGPGLFTANIVPPYSGWKEFRKHFEKGLKLLLQSYPHSAEFLVFEQLELRYIDGFTGAHGYTGEYSKFLNNELGLDFAFKGIPNISGNKTEFRGEFVVNCENIPESKGIISLQPNIIKNKPAVIMQLIARKQDFKDRMDQASLLEWFDESHIFLKTWFENICSDKLKKSYGKKVGI